MSADIEDGRHVPLDARLFGDLQQRVGIRLLSAGGQITTGDGGVQVKVGLAEGSKSKAKAEAAGDFASSIVLKAKNGKAELEIEGAIFGAKHPRIVRVNDFYLEAVPEGYILILQNKDVPGVIGMIGTILGNNGINIARMELGRSDKGGNAI